MVEKNEDYNVLTGMPFEIYTMYFCIRYDKNPTSWGNSMYSRISKNNLLVLPGVWFDSEWGFEGTDMNPFKKTDNINLFDGAFAWHWHNRWDEEIEEGSKFDILEKIINEKFNQL